MSLSNKPMIRTAQHQKILMMPLEASSMIGSLAGVAEIAKEAFGEPRK